MSSSGSCRRGAADRTVALNAPHDPTDGNSVATSRDSSASASANQIHGDIHFGNCTQDLAIAGPECLSVPEVHPSVAKRAELLGHLSGVPADGLSWSALHGMPGPGKRLLTALLDSHACSDAVERPDVVCLDCTNVAPGQSTRRVARSATMNPQQVGEAWVDNELACVLKFGPILDRDA